MATLRPTFSESWYRVADLKIKLRPSAQISRQFYRGDRWYVVRDPAGNQFHRLSAPAFRFIGLLDGSRTVAEAWELTGGQLADDAPTQNEVIQILSQLHSANLLESDVTPDAAVLLRRHKKMVKRQWQGRMMNILFPRIPLWDPDRFVCRWMPVMRPLLSWFGVLLWLAVVIWAVATIAPRMGELQSGAMDAIKPGNWPFLWATFVLIKAIHELGHAFACRRFGGEVHELGIMFLVLVPAPYVDASSAWSFPNKWARIFVGAGGMIFELFVAALAAFAWMHTADGTLLHQLSYNTMLIASVSTILFNANPLLRYDGYYILADWLEIPNLRNKSSEYSLGLIKRHLFRVKQMQPLPPVKQRAWLLSYFVTSTIYRTLIGIFIIFMVYREVPVLGVLMALGGVATWLIVPVAKLLKYLLLDAELHRKRTRAIGWVLGMAAATVFILGFIPFPWYYEARGIAEPYEKAVQHVETPGRVVEILVQDGERVQPGQVVLKLQDAELEARLSELAHRVAAATAELAGAEVRDPTLRKIMEDRLASLQSQLDTAKKDYEKLTVRATIAGRLIAPDMHTLSGKYLPRGQEVFTVAQLDRLRVTAIIDQDDAALAYRPQGRQAQLRLAGLQDGLPWFSDDLSGTLEAERNPSPTYEAPHPALTISGGGDAQNDPSDPNGLRLMRPHVVLWVTLDNPDHRYLPGQRTYLRFELEKQSLAKQWSRRIWQLIQTEATSKWM